VLDLSLGIAGPYCTRLLSGYGADVLKVEPPGGDPARTASPFPDDRPHRERSGLFLHLNAGKWSITLDPAGAIGRRLLLALAARADVLVESFGPEGLADLGLSPEVLHAFNPRLVITSMSHFGQAGLYRNWHGSDLIAYAMGGPLHETGVADLEPVKLASDLMYYQAGNIAAAATLGALRGVERAGLPGQRVDVNLFESQAGGIDRRLSHLLGYQFTGESMRREPVSVGILPFGFFPCADGSVYFWVMNHAWPRFATMVGRPDLIEDPRFTAQDAFYHPEIRDEIDLLFYPWLAERTKAEAMHAAQALRVSGAAVNTTADLMADEHFAARGFWAEADHPFAGHLTYPGAPFKMGAGAWAWRGPAPTLGQHNRAVYCGELGLSPAELARLREAGVV
jgi:crotonobetainyl-CoA:carnitine CoA-transferase CaiB-like acyl-CoA transferase